MIPFLDLKSYHLKHEDELLALCQRVISSGHYIQGPELDTFEKEFALYCGVKYCSGVANGLDAIHLALRALGVKSGDEIIVPAHTFIATWLAVNQSGATPVAVDVELETGNIDPNLVEQAITPKTKGIIGVHLQGRLCEIEKLKQISKTHKIFLIEDSAQAHGANRGGVYAGGFGDVGCFSFYPGKNLGAIGDAGAVTSNDFDLDEKVKILRNYGSKLKYHHIEPGFNSRLDEIQAGILRLKLRHLEAHNQRRQAIANIYRHRLASAPVILPKAATTDHVWHLFTILTPQRDSLQNFLAGRKIQTGIHYPFTPMESAVYREQFRNPGNRYPIATRIARETLSLPIGPLLDDDSVDSVCNAVLDYFEV